MYAEFEEKTYESLMNAEFNTKHNIFAPGPVFENLLGIDAAFYSHNINFWRLFNKKIPKGEYIKSELWDITEEKLKSDVFPPFKCNLFVQYKRSEYIKSARGKEFPYWKKPYFRYKINTQQNKTLCKLEQNISSSSIVVYGCSAFYKNMDLWEFSQAKKIIINSNFVKPLQLANHKRYTFTNHGKEGKAFSEPIDIETINIFKEIDKLTQESSFSDNVDFIYSLNNSIMKVVDDFDKEQKFAFKSMFENIKIPKNNLILKSFSNIILFNFITNTNWFIVV
ncbi:MAG: hypothetical protein AB1604_09890 [Euryarchaeota archaeon]